MADARGLHCPNCGAAAAPDAGRCPYCKARLATVSCPSCFALMFEGAAFCAACGAARARREPGGEAGTCPGCAGALRQVDVGGTSLLECEACDGTWIDAETFEALCADSDAQAAVLHRYGQRNPVATAEVKYRRCVRCGTLMNRVNFGRLSGAVVDVCRGHGTFLDAGELRHIVAFIHGGGLARARADEIEQLRLEQARLRVAESWSGRGRGTRDLDSGLTPRRSIATWDALSIADLIDFFAPGE